ncbi:MAG TPA: GNAT family N-acetyltransferase, partial [Saprospiraceae bacterium]|nr:GNAT family N-acetyltransferase [Saprospiraceae bacterium]
MCATSASVQIAGPVTATKKLRYSFFRSIEAAGGDWDIAAPAHDLFLQRKYLSIVEANPPHGMRFGYLVFYKDDTPVGVALCQIKYFKGDDNIADLDVVQTKDPCFFNGLAQWFKRWVAGKAAADILICGNMLLTGEHGYYFDYQKIDPIAAVEILENALDEVVDIMGREGVKMPVILVKDVAPEQRNQGRELIKNGFVEFDIQPNMVLHLAFPDFDGYLAAMSTKYRTRAKRAFKKLDGGVEKRELTLVEIQRELPRIYALYKDVAKNAGFNMVDLNEHYLLALKRDLGEHFKLFAYYLDGRIEAFYTVIKNGDELEAHFLGYDKAHNHDRQLYLNILYDIVRYGLDCKCHSIVFARTALEIKSSVGAVAHDLYCYLRHQNSIANKFTGTILDYLKPVEEWQPRHPFKEE